MRMRAIALLISLAPLATAPALAVEAPAGKRVLVCEAAPAKKSRTKGTVIGAVAGGVLGNVVASRGAKTEGAVVGAVVGGVAGNQIAKKKAEKQNCWYETR